METFSTIFIGLTVVVLVLTVIRVLYGAVKQAKAVSRSVRAKFIKSEMVPDGDGPYPESTFELEDGSKLVFYLDLSDRLFHSGDVGTLTYKGELYEGFEKSA